MGEENISDNTLNESEALQKIREQAHFIRSVTDTVPGIITITSYPEIEILFNNRETLELQGFHAGEIITLGHKGRTALIAPEDLQAVNDYYARFATLPDDKENRVEYRVKNKKGNLIWLDVRGRVFRRNEKGQAIQLLHIAQDITYQKNAALEIMQLKEEMARQANDKYHAIINSIDEGFCLVEIILNAAGKPVDLLYLETNQVFQRQTGLADVVGRRLREAVPTIEEKWIDFYGKVALTGEPARLEYYVESVNRWFTSHASRVGGESSLQVAVVFDDITERKLHEQKQAYFLKLGDALRTIADPVELEGAVTRIAMEYIGADRCFYVDIKDDLAIIRRDASRKGLPAVAGTYPLSSFPVFKKVIEDGRPFIVHDATTSAMLDEPLRALCIQLKVISFLDVPVIKKGKPVGILCFVQAVPRTWTEVETDVAAETAERIWAAVESAGAEEALRKSEALLASIFKVSPIGIGFTDINGKFLLVNDEMQRFMPTGKIPLSDDERLSHWVAWNKDGTPVSRDNYPGARALAGDPVMPYLEMLYTQDDGQEIWTRLATIPIKNDKQEIIGAVAVVTDINELKRTGDALKQSEQQLKALLKQRDEFIANASHELKTPVTSIKAYAELVQEMLQENGFTDEGSILQRLNAQIDRLTLLITYLLNTTKLAEGKLSFRFEPLQINDLLKERLEELGRTTTHRFLLQVTELPLVTADKERIAQVITNLLSNAIKYSPEGTTVTISTSLLANSIQVSILDQGHGISPDDQQKIFDRFFRVTSNNLDTYPGMGLGLFISAQIIERHGGTIAVKSMPGNGAEFLFTLPLKRE